MRFEAKTKAGHEDAREYLLSLTPRKRQDDALRMLEIFEGETGMPPVIWGGKMVGFGSYHYRYASGHEGDAMRVGFATGKTKISLYLWLEGEERDRILARLGRHTSGVGCVYINRLEDIDEGVLREMIRMALDRMERLYPQG